MKWWEPFSNNYTSDQIQFAMKRRKYSRNKQSIFDQYNVSTLQTINIFDFLI